MMSRGGGTPPSFWFLAKNCWTLKSVWAGALSSCKNQSPHCATFLDVFVAGSYAIISTHSSKTADLLLSWREKNFLCTVHPINIKNRNQHCLDNGANLPRSFFGMVEFGDYHWHSSSQRLLSYNSQQRDIHASCGIRTHSLSWRAAAGLRIRPHGYRTRRNLDSLYIYI